MTCFRKRLKTRGLEKLWGGQWYKCASCEEQFLGINVDWVRILATGNSFRVCDRCQKLMAEEIRNRSLKPLVVSH